MWKYKLIGAALFFKAFLGKVDFEAQRIDALQGKKYYDLEKYGEIYAPELSGMTEYDGSLYFITDSGGEEEIYVLSPDLKVSDTIVIKEATNKDWEALTVDEKGNFYIADFGNNLNRRQDLRIFKVNPKSKIIDTIQFSYGLQEQFPPEPRDRNFDSESIFWHNGQLHFFSKNRGRKCVKHYVIEDSVGKHELTPAEEFKMNGMITAADISPDGALVALLSYGKIYFFKKTGSKIFNNPVMLIETTRFGQSESLVFINNDELLIGNEAGKIFKIRIHKNLKRLRNKIS